ncbi:MAG: peptide MFS transporter [Planctomycetota bacterium]
MTDQAHAAASPAEVPRGHPPGLYMLFFAELWERFCYYGMRALLAFYVADQFLLGEDEASVTYGAYTSLVYATAILGGWVADKILGFRRSIIVGGLLMAVGEFVLMIPEQFYLMLGLALMVVGNGLFKPNISTVVGKLYAPGDPRRDQGFTIFYMGINVGAFLAGIVCGGIGETYGWHWGFMTAGAGMLLGIVTFVLGQGRLGEHGKSPPGQEGMVPVVQVLVGCAVLTAAVYFLLGKQEWMLVFLSSLMGAVILLLLGIGFRQDNVGRDRMIGLIILLFANMFFWALFEQAGSSLNFLARNYTDRHVVGGDSWEFPATWFQSVNAVCIVAFAPLFVIMWRWLDAVRKNPSIPVKFGLGIIPLGLGFGVLLLGIQLTGTGNNAFWIWLFLLYVLHTAGELCLSPVGLSAMTKLAPPSVGGMVMGAWFLSVAVGNYAAGQVAALVGSGAKEGEIASLSSYTDVFSSAMWASFIVGGFFVLIGPFVNKLLHGVR